MTLAPDTDRIESERLVLRRITGDDYDFFTRIHAMPEVGRYIGGPRSAESSRAWLEHNRALHESLSLGQLAVVRKSDRQLIGRCGLTELLVDVNAAAGTIPRGWFARGQVPAGMAPTLLPELSYTFEPASWGQGYATEAARRVFDYARANLRWPRIVSIIHPDNQPSLRVAARCGLRREGQLEFPEGLLDQYVWPR
jgi:RimJ/RimL family protein N-acetyltransferase